MARSIEVTESDWCGCDEMRYFTAGGAVCYIRHPWHDCTWVKAKDRNIQAWGRESDRLWQSPWD